MPKNNFLLWILVGIALILAISGGSFTFRTKTQGAVDAAQDVKIEEKLSKEDYYRDVKEIKDGLKFLIENLIENQNDQP